MKTKNDCDDDDDGILLIAMIHLYYCWCFFFWEKEVEVHSGFCFLPLNHKKSVWTMNGVVMVSATEIVWFSTVSVEHLAQIVRL